MPKNKYAPHTLTDRYVESLCPIMLWDKLNLLLLCCVALGSIVKCNPYAILKMSPNSDAHKYVMLSSRHCELNTNIIFTLKPHLQVPDISNVFLLKY